MFSVVPEMSLWVSRRKEWGWCSCSFLFSHQMRGAGTPMSWLKQVLSGAKPATDPADDLPASLAFLMEIGQNALPSEERSSIPWRQSEQGQDSQGRVWKLCLKNNRELQRRLCGGKRSPLFFCWCGSTLLQDHLPCHHVAHSLCFCWGALSLCSLWSCYMGLFPPV